MRDNLVWGLNDLDWCHAIKKLQMECEAFESKKSTSVRPCFYIIWASQKSTDKKIQREAKCILRLFFPPIWRRIAEMGRRNVSRDFERVNYWEKSRRYLLRSEKNVFDFTKCVFHAIQKFPQSWRPSFAREVNKQQFLPPSSISATTNALMKQRSEGGKGTTAVMMGAHLMKLRVGNTRKVEHVCGEERSHIRSSRG